MMYWMYDRPLDVTIHWIQSKFKKSPDLLKANEMALKSGFHYAETAEVIAVHYKIKPAKLKPGKYRNIMGNQATALGLIAASEQAGKPLFYCSYPITPASDILHELSHHKVAQVYLDHTGRNTDRQYGSATKAWRMDAVGLMTPLADDQRAPGEIAFTLSFDPPGKARRRTPDNWQDFEACTIHLRDDRWTSSFDERPRVTKLTPHGRLWHRALLDALTQTTTPGQTTRATWYAEAVRTGLADAITEEDSRASKDRKRALLRKYSTELSAANIIGINGEIVTLLSVP
jgi:hypothetical protein